MKIVKYSFSLLLLIIYTPTHAKAEDMSRYFQNKSGCFILYNVAEDRVLEKYNPDFCSTRIAPDSTFKIALSLMVFDQNIITPNTVFKWDGQAKGMSQWNHDQTPETWLKHSVVWVSQELTSQLGLKKIKKYLNEFQYGNQDFSGTPGKDDGLTQAWLSNSLKISADEQFIFLKKLIEHHLNVSRSSIELTKKNMFLQKIENGWDLYGKTGSGHDSNNLTEGWFVGILEKNQQKYIFVTNFRSLNKADATKAGGLTAKYIAIKILHDKGLI